MSSKSSNIYHSNNFGTKTQIKKEGNYLGNIKTTYVMDMGGTAKHREN